MIASTIEKFNLLYNKHFIITRSFLVIGASLIANVFAYLFTVTAGRYFSVSNYGDLGVLFALSGTIPLITQFYLSGIPKLVTEIKDNNYPHRLSKLFFSVFKINALVAIAVLVIMLISSDFIANYLKIPEVSTVRIFSFALSAGILVSFFPLFLQGLMRFKAFSFITVLTAVLKFAVALVVIYLGLTVKDIYTGLTITTILIGVLTFIILKKNIVKEPVYDLAKEDTMKLLKYSFGGAFALIGLNFVSNYDVVLVKHFFEPDVAGIYYSASVIGKIVYYAAVPAAVVMLPVCAEKFVKGENYVKPFFTSFGLSVGIAAIITLSYFLIPHFIISILFGERYIPAEPYLGLYAIFMLLYTILNMYALFLIAISRFRLSALTILAAISQYIGLHIFNNSIEQAIWVSIISVGSIALILAVSLLPTYFIKHNTN